MSIMLASRVALTELPNKNLTAFVLGKYNFAFILVVCCHTRMQQALLAAGEPFVFSRSLLD